MDKPSPYVGTRAYRRGEELFGREQETRDLVRLVLAERIVLLYSPSGAGKTSLLTAKVIPRLEGEDFLVLGPARVSDPRGGQVVTPSGELKPGDEVALQEVGASTRREDGGSINPYVASLISYWEEGRPESMPPLDRLAGIDLSGYLTQRSWIRSDPRTTVLVLDQFEEIFTLNPRDMEARKEFFMQLGRALQDRNRWALIAMREEHIAGLDPYLDFIPTRLATRYRLELLSPENAREAIAEPARPLGVSYHPDTLDRLISELTAVREREIVYHTAYVEPLHLQVVCDRLWQRLPAGTTEVGLDLPDTAGTVAKALAAYYREAVQAVIPMPAAVEARCDEKLVRDWFVNELISSTGLRNQLQSGGETTGGLPNAIVEAFKERYLLRSELRRGTIWYEIAHDRLIEAIKSDNAAWYESQPELRLLADQVKTWQDHLDAGRSSEADADLFTGEFLTRIEQWAERNGRSLSPTDRRFLNACRDRRKKEEEKVRTAKHVLQVRLRIAVASLFALLIIVAIYMHYKNEMEAKTAEYWAKYNSAAAQLKIHSLLSDAAGVRWRQGNHELSVLLSLQAERFSRDIGSPPNVSARIQESLLSTAALRPFTLSRQLANVNRTLWEPRQLAFSPDGRAIALASGQNEIEIVPLRADPADCSRPLIHTNDKILALNFSSSGGYLVAVTRSGAELFKTENLACAATPHRSLTPDLRAPTSLEPSGPFCTAADDTLLSLALPGGGVERWRLESGAFVHDGHFGEGAIPTNPAAGAETAIACDPEGDWTAVGNASGGITIRTRPSEDSSRSFSLQNSLNAWPDDIRDDFKFLEADLDFGVSELLPWPEANHIIAIFRHGPPALISLSAGANQEPSLVYLRPTQFSEEKLEMLAAQGRVSRTLVHKPKLLEAAFDAGRQRLVVGGERHIGEWDLGTCQSDPCGETETDRKPSPTPQQLFARYSEVRASQAPIAALGILKNGDITADADAELNIRLRLAGGLGNVGTSNSLIRIEGDEDGPGVLYSMLFLRDGHTLAAGGSKYLDFLNVKREDLTLSGNAALPCIPRSIRAMALSPDGHRLALITRRNTQRIPACLTSPAWGKDTALLMDLRRESGAGSPGEPEVLEAGESGMWSAVWANGPWTGGRNLLAAGDYSGRIRIWRWEEGGTSTIDSPPQQLPINHLSPVWTLAFHPSEPYLAVGADDGSLEILRLQVDKEGQISTEALQNPAWVKRGPVRALAWSSDGDTLVFGNESGTIGLISTTHLKAGSWEESRHAFAHSMGVTTLVFGESSTSGAARIGSSGSHLHAALASAGGDGKVKLWDLQKERSEPNASLELRLTLEGPRAEAQSIAFSPDGKLIAAGDATGHVHLWRTELPPLLEDACAHMGRNLSWPEWLEYVGEHVDYQSTCPNLPPGAGVRAGTDRQE